MLSNVLNDIRYALRTLGRNPGFAAAAIVPIALGIGINTGVFSILNSVAWRPLPVPDPDALVSIHQEFRGGPRRLVYGARSLFSIPEYRSYRDGTQTLSGLMAYSREWTVTLGRETPQEIGGVLVTCNYFDVLGLAPAIGTGFTSANCSAPDAPPTVVLSHALWTRSFGADPNVLQRPIVLNGRDVTVVGVAPAGFDGVDMAKASFFAPTTMMAVFRPDQTFHEGNVSWLTFVGRRRDATDIAQVRADLAIVASRIDQQQPGRTTSLIVAPAAALSLPVARRTILRGAAIVMAAFVVVLLIASANVANIMLARGAARTREIAIRLSVGATRGRLVQQLLTESIVIALAGACFGSLLFSWSFQALIPWLLSSVPDAHLLRVDATPDRNVLWFGLGLTALTTLVFGLMPALQASAGSVHAATKHDTAGSSGGRGWIRGTLIGSQIALCTMLLIPAGLLSRALNAAYTFDPGFDHQNVAVVSIDLRGPRYEKGNAALFHEQWLERVTRPARCRKRRPGEPYSLESRPQPEHVSPCRRARGTSRRREHRVSRFLFGARHPARPRSRIHGRRSRRRTRDRIHGAALLARTGRDRPHDHHGQPPSPHCGNRPGRAGLAGPGGGLELHVSAREARTHNEASPFLHGRASISTDSRRRSAPRRHRWMRASS